MYKTQMEAAKKGILTKEMKSIAESEAMDEKILMQRVASGEIAIPANKNHSSLVAKGVGSGLSTKINVNLGISKDCPDVDKELEKVKVAIDMKADAIMDLSSFGKTEEFRKKLIAMSTAMIGTVPVYDAIGFYDKELKDGEAIVGSHVVGEKGEKVHFFNEELKIVGRLKQTGIGFDATVFVNQNTAKQLAKASERITANKVAEEDVISSVMIKAKPGVDSVKLASKISKELSKEGIFAMFSKKFVNSISSNLKVLSTSILILVGAIWILSVVILSISFTAIFNERKKEMAVLRVLGASKKMLREIILKEAVILSLWGAGIGSFLGVILSIIQLPLLASKFSMPFLSPSLLQYIGIFILSFVLGVFIGPLSTVRVVKKLTDKDSYLSLREEM